MSLIDATDSIEYQLIHAYYGDRCAVRSGVPLINHINEGLALMRVLNATFTSQLAYCIHPLLQSDDEVANHLETLTRLCDPYAVALAMEYRGVANEYLSHRTIQSLTEIRLSPLSEVTDMLIADKVQNYKDFLLYHNNTHPRSVELNRYFRNWLMRLQVINLFNEWKEGLENV